MIKRINEWALYFTMNWLYSDFTVDLLEIIKGNLADFVKLIYNMNISKLHNSDVPRWIHSHLKLEGENNVYKEAVP